jgi:hypothetical protein
VAALIGTQFSRCTGTKAQILTQLRQGAEATPGMIHMSQVALLAHNRTFTPVFVLLYLSCAAPAAQLSPYLYFCTLKVPPHRRTQVQILTQLCYRHRRDALLHPKDRLIRVPPPPHAPALMRGATIGHAPEAPDRTLSHEQPHRNALAIVRELAQVSVTNADEC